MARQPLIFHPLYLFFLICSSCAWVGSVAAFGPNPAPVLASDAGTGRVERVDAVRDGCHAMITPPPSLFLLARQDQGQIQALSDQLRQLSAQSRSVSQSSQQLSQSLQQATQRLSQTEQQLASARAQQSAAEAASRSMSQASAEASRSAERVLSEASRAMSQAMSSVTSSMGASFASALASASRSISAVRVSAASVIQAAQADATALRNEAQTQVQQAQGAALSVTQIALAVVGGIVGSSLLTVLGFVLILRHRRKKRRGGLGGGRIGLGSGRWRSGSGNPNIGHPELVKTSNKAYAAFASGGSKAGNEAPSDDGSSSIYSMGEKENGGEFRKGLSDTDVQASLQLAAALAAPPAAALARANTTITRKSVGTGIKSDRANDGEMGHAVSYHCPSWKSQSSPPAGVLGDGEGGGKFQPGKPPLGGKFTLFPRSRAEYSPWSASAGSPVEKGYGERASRSSFPTLDAWLQSGTTVSPFSTLKR